MRVAPLFVALALLAGCSSDPAETPITPVETSTDDTSIAIDSAPGEDTGTDTSLPGDTAVADDAVDAAPRFDILGTLAGDCGGLAAELTKPTPSLFVNNLAFTMSEKYVREAVSMPDGQKIFDAENAGGSSGESEVMSFEILHYCDDATLRKTETAIEYNPPDDSGPSSITDILVSIAGQKVGVSVTRVYKPAPQPLTDAIAKEILEKKFDGINRSTERVKDGDKWIKQILHVFVANAAAEEAVKRVLPTITAARRANTIVVLTRTLGGGFIYCDPDPQLGSECPPL